jgi:GT2 family glycosyltransferase
MNAVLILSYNGLPMLKKCVESVRRQDIPTQLYVYDNGSTDGTVEWLRGQVLEKKLGYNGSSVNLGVSKGWNEGLDYLFGHMNYESVLVLNQDLQLGSSFLRQLLEFNAPFVTGFPVSTEFEMSPLAAKPQMGLSPYPCFSAFLIRREAWEKIGPFKEPSSPDASDGFFAWAGDCDYHIRGHRLGVGMFKSGVPFYHESGSTMRNAPEEEKQWFVERANKDREYFRSLYGCVPGEEPAYGDLFK